MSELKLLFYRLKLILGNFPEFWNALDKANQLALVLIPFSIFLAVLNLPLSDLVAGVAFGIFVTKYLQMKEAKED